MKLEAVQLEKFFGDRKVVNGVSLDVNTGEVVLPNCVTLC